jgi:soluble lytic murein transglycosylase-like protein
MPKVTRRVFAGIALTLFAGCSKAPEPAPSPANVVGNTPQMQALVEKYADLYDMPASLIHRVIQRESGYNPAARNGPYYGLMQILPQTAGTMGYDGAPEGLLDADTNLRYAGKYLRGAWLVSRGDEGAAVGWYARGYYYEAKRLGLLQETGLQG